MTTARTRLVGLLGNPVAHSLSPAMQNAALRKMGFNAAYLAFPVDREDLPRALEGLRALGALGTNVTIPFKEEAFRLMDEVEPEAAVLGAVNTVVFRNGRSIGGNTDVHGTAKALEALAPKERSALLLGAGGAGRGAALALLRAGFSPVFVANRHRKRAEKLALDLGPEAKPGQLRVVSWEKNPPEPFGLLVNTTSLGLGGNLWPYEDLDRFLSAGIRGKLKVLDLVYGPHGETQLTVEAWKRDIPALDGLEALLHQGAASFRLFTGLEAPVDVMRRALRKARGVWEEPQEEKP
ncbi:MAG: shikimate dehydrogenase [Synergistales bacterium]|jgi:shikimate dehydrogenase